LVSFKIPYSVTSHLNSYTGNSSKKEKKNIPVIINFPKTLNVNNDKQTVTPSSHKKCTSIEIRKAKKAKKRRRRERTARISH
jgi:hypothetical protein